MNSKSCLVCSKYKPFDEPLVRTGSRGIEVTIYGLCAEGADSIVGGYPVYIPAAFCDKIEQVEKNHEMAG